MFKKPPAPGTQHYRRRSRREFLGLGRLGGAKPHGRRQSRWSDMSKLESAADLAALPMNF